MRKIAAIFLSAILLFNWFGYRCILGFWQQQTTRDLEARIDVNDYDETQLISVKVPVTHLAYYNTSPTFQRVNGRMEINGIEYKYVKRRLFNDTLELLCLPDGGTMKLRAYANEIYRMTNGLQATPGKHTGAQNVPVKILLADPYVVTDGFVAQTPSLPVSHLYGDHSFVFVSSTLLVDEQPPDQLG